MKCVNVSGDEEWIDRFINNIVRYSATVLTVDHDFLIFYRKTNQKYQSFKAIVIFFYAALLIQKGIFKFYMQISSA